MPTIGIEIDEEMTNFMIRNILGHEPCHDFNPAGAGSRYVKLNKQLENLKIGGIYQEGGSGNYDGSMDLAPTATSASGNRRPFSSSTSSATSTSASGNPRPFSSSAPTASPVTVFSLGDIDSDGKGDDNVEIKTYEDMKDDSPSTVFNNIAKSENDLLVPNVDRDGLITGGPDNESIIFHSTLGTDYNSFLNEFDVDANNMDNKLVLGAQTIRRMTTRSMTQSRSNTINGIQSTTEMTDYIRLYMFNYIAGYTSSVGVGLNSDGYYGGKVNKPDKSMIKEEIEEKNDNALMPIENKKKKTDIATTLTKGESELKQGIQEGDSELKQGIQEGEAEAEAAVSKEESATQAIVSKEEAEAEAAVSKEESATQAIVSKEEAEAQAAAQAAASVEAEAPTLEAAAAPSAPAAEPTASVQAASTVEAAPAVEAEAEAEAPTAEAASTAEATISDRYQEYSYLNNALTHIIKEFDEYDKLDDDALIDVWSIDTDISRPYLKETNNIFVFYKYIFNYYINNINNILSIYLINDSYFIRDAIFFFFINHFNSNEEKFLEIKDEEKKKGILNEIFNLRIPEWSDDNKYLTSIKKNKKEEIVEKQIKEENIYIKKIQGQTGGDDDDEVIFSLQIINMTTGLGPVTPVFNNSPKTVTIGDTVITNQDELIIVLQEVYERLINGLMAQIQAEGNDKYVVPRNFNTIIGALQGQLIGEFVTNPKSFIQQLKPKRGNGSLFTLINNYNTGGGRGRALQPENLKISINNAINTITTNLKARIIKLVSVTKYKFQIQGTKTTSLSPEAQVPVNMILQKVCEKVNDIIGITSTMTPAENNSVAQANANNGDIFLTQKHIIDKIATGGSTSDVDTKLYVGFRNWLNNNDQRLMTQQVYDSVPSWTPEKLRLFIQPETATKPIKVINNALSDKSASGEKMIKVLSDYKDNDKFKIKCPISSIFDAQGSFGSCNFGLDENKRKNNGTTKSNRHNADVIKDNMDIQITGTNNFFITFNLIFKAKVGNTGRALLIYTIRPGENYKENDGNYKTITGTIDSVIRDEAIDILSAKTVFKGVFNDITAGLGNRYLTSYLEDANAIHTIMSGLTQKFMGDFGQELNAIATNFGKGGSADSYTLLADGDRPSFVRASLLRLLATKGIDPYSYLWFMSPKGGVAVGPLVRPVFRGGTIKKKTKKRNNKKKRKNRKTNKKKSKTRKNKTRKNKRKTKKSKKTIKKR